MAVIVSRLCLACGASGLSPKVVNFISKLLAALTAAYKVILNAIFVFPGCGCDGLESKGVWFCRSSAEVAKLIKLVLTLGRPYFEEGLKKRETLGQCEYRG